MTHTRLLIVAAIISILILASFAFSVPRVKDGEVSLQAPAEVLSVPSVIVRDSFKKGVHTITGSLEVPNSCVSIETKSSASAENILVSISIPEDSDVCLQRKTNVKFSTSVTAPANLPVLVTVNGVTATTTSL